MPIFTVDTKGVHLFLAGSDLGATHLSGQRTGHPADLTKTPRGGASGITGARQSLRVRVSGDG